MTNSANTEKHDALSSVSEQHDSEQRGDSEPNGPGEDNASASCLDKKLQELEAQVKEKEAKYVYLYADFENFKKRAIRERSDLIKFGWESLARELLQVVDNLERALVHVPPGTDKNFVAGIRMTLDHLESTLEKQGVKTVESVKQAFDPNLHEAVGQESSEHPEGTIVKEHTRGYTLHGRLLRPARVVLSGGKGPS